MSACTECHCREGVFPCSRCVRNGRACVQPHGAGASAANSAHNAPSSGSPQIKVPPFKTTGFHPKMMTLVDTLPSDHVGLAVMLAYFAGVFSTYGCQDMLAQVVVSATEMGWGMPTLQVVLKTAGENIQLNSSLLWSDLPSTFTEQHDGVINQSGFPAARVHRWARFNESTLHFGRFDVFRHVYGTDAPPDGFVNGVMAVLSACSDFGMIKTVFVHPQLGVPAMYMTMSVLSATDVLFAWDMKNPTETAAGELASPHDVPSFEWSLSENDVDILLTVFE